MRPPRAPVVAGTAGGVGTSTVAAALHALDAGRATTAADVLVCRADVEGLRHALTLAPGPGQPPVLAVNSGPVRGPARDLLDPLAGRYAAVVVLPEVRLWRGIDDPLAAAARTLARDPAGLPRGLRLYADELRAVAAAVTSSGRLAGSRSIAAPAAPGLGLWIGLCGVEHPVPCGDGEPDDLTLDPDEPTDSESSDAVGD